ncbi:APC family permease [Pseudonocardia acaciae]|uniref:APC family permease n=1 Tax=Pseudonocardia acaciae TaxID=551276 RepID=UPI000491FC2B|nr:APC family permease [Pseudonocardia acaciae]
MANLTSEQTRLTLGARGLGLTDVVAQALGAVGPVFGALTFLPLIAGGGGAGAGGAVPLSILFSAAAVFGVAWTLSRFARRLDTTGSVYDYISRSFGDRAGTAFGSLSYFATILGIATTPLIFGGYLEDFLASRFGLTAPWWLISLGFVVVVAVVLALGVSISTRAQLALTLLSMLTVIAFSVSVIVRGLAGGAVPAQAPFDVGSSTGGWLGVCWGLLYGLFIFSGFESAANLAEETPNPKRSVPRAMLITVGLVTTFHLLVAYATVVGFGLDGGEVARYPVPLLALAAPGSFGAAWLVDLLTVMVLLDIFALTVAICVGGSRGLFALARDGRLPAAFTKVSRTRNIPVLGVTVPVVWMAVVVIAVHVTGGLLSRAQEGSDQLAPEYMPVFSWLGGLQGLVTAITWGTVCLGALGWLRRRDSRRGYLVGAAGLGVLAGCGVLFASLYHAPASVYVALALVIAFLIFSVAQSTIQRRRGRFTVSAARLVDSEED